MGADSAPRLVAFLRAINVGGHVITMDRLRQIVEGAGLAGVATYIASGNVLFDAPRGLKVFAPLERKIAAALHKGLGYEVATFIRTAGEVSEAAAKVPFTKREVEGFAALSVAFLAAPLGVSQKKALAGLVTEVDQLKPQGREIYWGCRVKQSDSKFSNAVLERKLGVEATFRSIKTVRAVAERLARSVGL